MEQPKSLRISKPRVDSDLFNVYKNNRFIATLHRPKIETDEFEEEYGEWILGDTHHILDSNEIAWLKFKADELNEKIEPSWLTQSLKALFGDIF